MNAQTQTGTMGSIGWQVISEGFSGFNADGSMMPGRWKWSAYTLDSGAWGYEDTSERACERAADEFARLGGGES